METFLFIAFTLILFFLNFTCIMYYNKFLEHFLTELEYYNSFFIFMNWTLPAEFLMRISVVPNCSN